MNSTVVNHTALANEVISPAIEIIVQAIPCPANTYNRVCAHTKQYHYIMGRMDRYNCTPCPPGFHTAGLTGQWFCRPPLCNVFTFQPLATVSNLWGNRDLLSAAQNFRELECGYTPAHCMQPDCAPGMLPEDFNELWVFSKLLQTRGCSSGFYCPDAFTEVACPSNRPWSPPNSSLQAQCGCLAGKYLSNGTTLCVPCTARCTQTAGYYLPVSQCLAKNGAIADAPCLPCSNLPPALATSTRLGIELPSVGGICPFACAYGSLLVQLSTGACASQYSCQPVTRIPSLNGNYVYYGGQLPVDSFAVDSTSCQKSHLLTDALNSLYVANAAGQWVPQPTSCFPQCQRQLCYAANASSIVDPLNPWYGLGAPVTCVQCPATAPLPTNAWIKSYTALAQQSACQTSFIKCFDGLYFNQTAWQCQSCIQRELQVCPTGTKLRGQGCLNSSKPFNLSAPVADCMPCTLSMPDPCSQTFLNYNSLNGSSEIGGCAIEKCATLPPLYYWSRPCGGDSPGTQTQCSLSDCPAWQYLAAACASDADRVCANCTTFNPGFYKLDSCTQLADSAWRPCTQGFYCNGTGAQAACPANSTSQPNAKQLSDCYCRVGMQEASNAAVCVPKRCAGAVQDPSIPGVSLLSASFMTLNPITLSSTVCLPCGGGAMTWGSGIEVTSCACPAKSFAVPNGTGLSCLPCASYAPPPCQDKLSLQPSCPRTLTPGCSCALAPFAG